MIELKNLLFWNFFITILRLEENMSIITKKDIEYVANLARLEVKEDELEEVTRKMEFIVELANKLSEVDTSNAEPTNLAIDLVNVFREDEVRPSYAQEEMLKNAPTKVDGCYAVPETFEE